VTDTYAEAGIPPHHTFRELYMRNKDLM
jgi:hypothetical protein